MKALKVGAQYNREEIYNYASAKKWKLWQETSTTNPLDVFGVKTDEQPLSVALTPKGKHFIKITMKNAESHVFQEVLMPHKTDIYIKIK